MNTATRTSLYAIVLGALTLTLYYLATNLVFLEFDSYAAPWSPITGVIMGGLGLAAGAIWGTRGALSEWRTVDVILTAVLAVVFGLLFVAWGVVYEMGRFLQTVLPGLIDLTYGFWFIAAIIAPYIIRKPGAAIAAETLAALAELLAGAPWGITLLVSGLVQGALAEVVFALRGYTRYDLPTLMLAGAAAGIGSLIVDRIFWYPDLLPAVLLVMLAARLISGALLGGWFSKTLADGLARSGALNSFALGIERQERV